MSIISDTINKSIANVKSMEPATKDKFLNFLRTVLSELNIPLLLYSGTRNYAEQWDLRKKYLMGGAQASAPGYSWHNFGRAGDVVPITLTGIADWNSSKWPEIIAIAQRYGLISGISFGDTNHFANKEGATLVSLRAQNPVPTKYTEIDKPEIPKDVELKPAPAPVFPSWLPLTVTGLGLILLTLLLIPRK